MGGSFLPVYGRIASSATHLSGPVPTYQIVMTLTIKDSPAVTQAWLMGVNPELGDCVPIPEEQRANS